MRNRSVAYAAGALLFGGLCALFLARPQAATYSQALEAEAGSRAGAGTSLSLAGTSAGFGVTFGIAPPLPIPDTTEFGFLVGYDSEKPDWPALKSDIDTVAAAGQQWVRIGIAGDLVTTGGSATAIQWDQAGLKLYDDAFDYASQKGLKIVVTTSGAPWWAGGFSYADYKKASSGYWSFMAQRWKAQIDMWQAFNESDSSHYQTYAELPYDLPADYLRQMDELLAEARRVIKAANPSIAVTTNSTGYPVTVETQAYYFKYFDAIKDNLDLITLDLYPDGNDDMVAQAAQRVSDAIARYKLPVSVGETGMPTCTGCYTAADVSRYMPQTIAQMKQAGARQVIYYELRDSGTDLTDGESTFGLMKYDGTRKPFFDTVVQAMR